jgi:hypothetical protein
MFTFTSIVLEVVEMAEEKETNTSEMESQHKNASDGRSHRQINRSS